MFSRPPKDHAPLTDTAMATDTATATDTAAAGTIVDVAAATPDLSILVEAVQAAGLAGTLGGDGPFTVVAPTNEAFEAALAALGLTKEQLLANESLADILTYHVLAGAVGSADIASEPSRVTVQGEPVEIASDGGAVTVNGSATVVMPDVLASNGVVHVIDAVLLPPGMAEALGAGGATGDQDTEPATTGR
jgi:transforming growth factor-beta-induced protein